MTQEAASISYWGRSFEGRGLLPEAREVIETAARQRGQRVEAGWTPTGALVLITHEPRPAWQRLLRRLPARVCWLLEQDGERLRVVLDLRWGRPEGTLAGLFTLGALAVATLWAHGLYGPLVGLALMLGAYSTTRALGGAISDRWFQVLLSSPELSDRTLGPAGRGVGRRYAFASLGSLALGAVLTAAVLTGEPQGSVSWLPIGVLLMAASLVAALALLLVRSAAASLRLLPLLGGVSGALFALLFTLWWQLLPLTCVQAGVPARLEGATAEVQPWLRDLAWFGFGGVTLLLVVCLGLARSLAASFRVLPKELQQLAQRGRRAGVYHQAVADPGLLTTVRWLLVSSLAALSLLTLAGLGNALWHTLRVFIPKLPGWPLPELYGQLGAAALGLPWNLPAAQTLAQGAWVVATAAVFLLLGVSLGQRARSRRALARDSASSLPHPNAATARAQLAQLGELSKLPGLVLWVRDGPTAPAEAIRLGGLRPRRVVAVSTLALEVCEGAERYALLAHEVAHHARGHTLALEFLAWLGRLTFVGEGFVLALQDSVRYELTADHHAVCRLGADRGAMVRLLDQLPRLSLASAPATSEDAPAASVWRFLWLQFTGRLHHLHSWHPSLDTRRAALKELLCP